MFHLCIPILFYFLFIYKFHIQNYLFRFRSKSFHSFVISLCLFYPFPSRIIFHVVLYLYYCIFSFVYKFHIQNYLFCFYSKHFHLFYDLSISSTRCISVYNLMSFFEILFHPIFVHVYSIYLLYIFFIYRFHIQTFSFYKQLYY